MGWPHLFDQGLTGLVLQLLQRRGSDADGQGFCLGFEVAGAFSQNAEHDLSGDMTVSVTKRFGYGTHVCKVRYTDQQLKFLDGSLVETYSGMTIQQADGFSQEPTPVGSAYAWDDYTVDDVINNDTTWNGVQLRANLI